MLGLHSEGIGQAMSRGPKSQIGNQEGDVYGLNPRL